LMKPGQVRGQTMALRVQRSALFLVAIVLTGCEPGGPFATMGGQGPTTSNPSITQTGSSTVRQRVAQLRSDQSALSNAISHRDTQRQGPRKPAARPIARETSAYASLTNGITSRLQGGTTPGNPDLVNQWNSAQGKLDAITVNVGTLNSLATQVTTEASVAGYL